jgi:hypothetical protein
MTTLLPLQRFPRMMQEYVTARLRENYRADHARAMSLKTPDEALTCCAEVTGDREPMPPRK